MGSAADVTRAAQAVGSSRGPSIQASLVEQDLDERRQSLRRFYGMAILVWIFFIVVDLVVVYANSAAESSRASMAGLAWLVGLRFIGTFVGLVGWMTLESGSPSHSRLTVIDTSMTVTAAFLVSLGAVVYGGLSSHLLQGVGMVSIVRSVVPGPWRRSLPIALACVASFPLTVGAASLFSDEIRAQWSSYAILSVYAQNQLFVVLGALAGAWASHVQWRARRELSQARRLGAYRLKVRIGGGGMGEVWLARQDPLCRQVALKLLREGAAMRPDAVRRFEIEARAASQLTHPNTIKVFDFGASEDGVFYIAMEFLHGLDLEDLVSAAGPLSPARVIHIARQACASLAEAHQRGIIHRDVKPANLFLTTVAEDDDFVKVLDFGVAHIARDRGVESSMAETGVCGTPAFMPPEIVKGDRVVPASDVYSMGAVMYFLLCGEELFKNLSFGATVMAQVSKTPDPPSKRLGASLPTDLERVVMRCLAKKPDERYASARELGLALAECEDAGKWSHDDARSAWSNLRPSLRFRFGAPA